MTAMICTKKITDNQDKTVKYELRSKSGNVNTVDADNLKQMISSGQVVVSNISINSNNNLVYNKSNKVGLKPVYLTKKLVNRLKFARTLKFESGVSDLLLYISRASNNGLMIDNMDTGIYRIMDDEDNVTVITSGQFYFPKDSYELFKCLNATYINISEVDISEVETIKYIIEARKHKITVDVITRLRLKT